MDEIPSGISAEKFPSRTCASWAGTPSSVLVPANTSEIVTNAVQHTKSGVDDGTVTIVVIRVPHGVLVEVIDDGSAGTPVVKGDLYAADGHGLFLVQRLAAQWGYLREPAGTTVWFHLPAADRPQLVPDPAIPRSDAQAVRQPGRPDGRPTQLWAATVRPATV